MKKKTWSIVGIVIGVLLVLGALGSIIPLARIAQLEDQEFWKPALVTGGSFCAVQLLAGVVILWFAVRSFRRNSATSVR